MKSRIVVCSHCSSIALKIVGKRVICNLIGQVLKYGQTENTNRDRWRMGKEGKRKGMNHMPFAICPICDIHCTMNVEQEKKMKRKEMFQRFCICHVYHWEYISKATLTSHPAPLGLEDDAHLQDRYRVKSL
jgi:hypothetical protein